MKIIKIDKKSIRKNPTAGNEISHIAMGWKTEFETNIPRKKLPKWMREGIYESEATPIGITFRGEIRSNFVIEELQKLIESTKRKYILNVKMNREIQHVRHFPEPAYFYEYKKTFLKCSHCKNKIEVNEIQEDWIDDGYPIKVCPICKHEDTFPEYKYEKISNVLKELEEKYNA